MSDRLTQLEQLHADDPNDPFLAYGIALEHFKLGDHDTALDWLDKTLALDAHYCYAYFQKAKILSDQGDDDEAKEILETGMKAAIEAGDDHARSEMMDLMETL